MLSNIMKRKVYFSTALACLFLSASLYAQNLSAVGSGSSSRQHEANLSSFNLYGYGTGEYFLVPAIDRKDPAGTSIRMNTNGAALLALLDKNALGGLTDEQTLPLTKNTVLQIAESRFRTAIRFEPNNYLYHANLAAALYRQNRIDEALSAIRRAIELNPKDENLKSTEETILRVKVTVQILDDEAIENK